MNKKLNICQQNAINVTENALILACPGSGKTEVLTLKISNELSALSKRTHRIAALTFTNRAAIEIDKRINLKGMDTSQLWTGTIHAFCLNWIIKPYGLYLPDLKNGYSIIEKDVENEIKKIYKERYSLTDNFTTKRDRDGNYINEIECYNKVSEEYHKYIFSKKLIDFDSILYFSYFLLRKYNKISINLSKIFKYFFIDEYQDTQDLQYAIVGKIIQASEGECKIFLVGDPDQAIFTSLGGTLKSAKEISAELGGDNVIELGLSDNYRSTQRIVNLFSGFQSTDLKIKSSASYCDEKGIVEIDKHIHKNQLVNRFVDIIKESLSRNVHPEDICILGPNWFMIMKIARELKKKLPEVDFDSPSLSPLVHDQNNIWFKIARVILKDKTPHNYYLRMRWIKEILEELSVITCNNLDFSKKSCRKISKVLNFKIVDTDDAIQFLKEKFKLVCRELTIDYMANDLLIEQWDNFFSNLTKRYVSKDFREAPKDIMYMKKMFNNNGGIVISTFQGIKGEEFHTVISFGLHRGFLPHRSDIEGKSSEHEKSVSNKLLYVICSRAKKNLYLFAETGRIDQSKVSYKINRELDSIDFQFD